MAFKKKVFTIFLPLLIVFFLASSGIFLYGFLTGRALFREDLKRFSQESYESVFLSMHSAAGYTQENFLTYRGLNTCVSPYEIQTTEKLRSYLEEIFSSGNSVSNIFLMLDPDMIWKACGESEARWNAALQRDFFSFVTAYPEVRFEILLPYPSLSYWLDMEQAAFDDVLNVYRRFMEEASAYPNSSVYYMGSKKWLIFNPDNYVSSFDLNDEIAKKVFLYCFCDHVNQVDSSNADAFLGELRELVLAERTSPTVYPDLSDRCLVFFGDSILAYGSGTTTTAGYVTGFSDAVVHNYAVGGTAISAPQNFPALWSRFLSEDCVQENGTYRFSPKGVDLSDKKLYFFFLYGANDYFNGAAVENPDDPYDPATYKGGLRNCLNLCREAFPNAELIVITPHFISYFSNGMERNSDVGGILTDYVDAAISVAEELGVHYIDHYRGLGIDASNILEYLADGCHPNENGRMLMANHIINLVSGL